MKKLFVLLLPPLLLLGGFQVAVAQDCVEVDLELPDTVVAGPGQFGEGYFEQTNCGMVFL